MAHPIPKRILVLGAPGSGKSTYSKELADALDLPCYELDQYVQLLNDNETNYNNFILTQTSIVSKDRWVIDGAQLESLNIRYGRADLVIYLHCPRWKCFYRILKRSIQYIFKHGLASRSWSLRLFPYMFKYNAHAYKVIQLYQCIYPNVEYIDIYQ